MGGSLAVAELLLAFAGCAARPGIHASRQQLATQAQERRQMLFGGWIENESIDCGGTRVEMALPCPDGVFLFDFRTLNAAGVLVDEDQEVGDRGISGPVYFTITRAIQVGGHTDRAASSDGYHYDAHRIVGLSYTDFRYRAYVSGDRFVAHRALPVGLSALRRTAGTMALPAACGTAGDVSRAPEEALLRR